MKSILAFLAATVISLALVSILSPEPAAPTRCYSNRHTLLCIYNTSDSSQPEHRELEATGHLYANVYARDAGSGKVRLLRG